MPLLTVGRIVRPHGVRGEVVVEVRTDEPEARYAVGSVLRTERAALTVAAARPHHGAGRGGGRGLIVAFRGVPDRTAAEALRGVLLHVDSGGAAPPTDPDEFPDHQLVGLAAVSPAGEPLGEVARIDHAPPTHLPGPLQDLLVVERPDGRTALVPFVVAIVPEVDVAGGRIVIDAPPGLLDL